MNRYDKLVNALTIYILNEAITTQKLEISENIKLRQLYARLQKNYLRSGELAGEDFKYWMTKYKPDIEYTDNTELSKWDLNLDTTYAILNGTKFPRRTKFTLDWSHSKFRGSYLAEAKFIAGNFEDVDFTEANLSMADLSNSFFNKANFTDARLYKANLSPAAHELAHAFSGAIFTRTDLSYSKLQGTDLSGTIDLHTANLSAAEYDDFTIFPEKFEYRYPEKYRSMIYMGKDEAHPSARYVGELREKYRIG